MTKFKYQKALRRINELSVKINELDGDVDQLLAYSEESKELIDQCKRHLLKIEMKVSDIFEPKND